ncbi:amidase [Marinobacter sp. M3C]|jgi:aspartyl-tRNA(Asn)/glutamyl-tRNA(Gln) amidotransferase subunit A|uniref:amidase n=1 Tax=Marinobacter sp. M3C TaxID=2917715 RepID=UPI00200BB8BC|nr:amidase [Marinobacter sp. M3C]UQG60855.1 amidase [Marinobacter sp. M3C]
MPIPSDPIAPIGLEGFAKSMRQGKITSEQVVKAYLERIELLDPLLGAFERVDSERALIVARAMDALLAEGIDLGPLMGLPISVKDIFVFDGNYPHAGSNLSLQNKYQPQDSSFITALKEAGCVILGTTRMVEFALGITGHSVSRGTPWNPWDEHQHRLPGGSSSGAAVALSAGMCALSIGSDTGGSVRVPAAMCGLFGLKTTAGLWPTDGVFPLDPQTDSIGLLTRSARDAQLAFQALNSRINPCDLKQTKCSNPPRLGRPTRYMLDDLSPDVSRAFEKAITALKEKNAEIVSLDIPNIEGRERYFPIAMPSELLSWLGEKTFNDQKELIDPTIRVRIEKGLTIKAHDYLTVSAERHAHVKEADKLFDAVDLIISPTTQETALPIKSLEDPDNAMRAAMSMTRNTQPANYFDWCAVTLPIGLDSSGLPMGLQLNTRGMTESNLLAMAVWVESVCCENLRPSSFQGTELI